MQQGTRRAGVAVALAAAIVGVWATGCEDPAAPFFGVNAVSTVVQGHSHRATVPRQDIDTPPSGGRSYESTTDAGHSHDVRLTATELVDLQTEGHSVSVVSTNSDVPAPHVHNFEFVR